MNADDLLSVAVREAGHAMACFMVSREMGNTPVEMVEWIRLYPGSTDLKWTRDGRAYTRGPGGQLSGIRYSRAMLDAKDWAEAYLVILVAGPLAQARYAKMPIREAFATGENRLDIRDAIKTCETAGIPLEDIAGMIQMAVQRVDDAFAVRTFWNALMVLATELVDKKRLTASEAWAAFRHGLRKQSAGFEQFQVYCTVAARRWRGR